MTDLTLYTNPMSRGRIARWMLEETGQPYRTVVLDYGTAMDSADYRALNPMGKVPTLVHDGRVVTECAAICAYLAEAFPAAGLLAEDRAAYFRWLFFAAGPMEQAIVNRSFGWQADSAQDRRRLGYGSFGQVVDTLAAYLATTPYIAGKHFSAADVYVGSQVGWGLQFGTLPSNDAFVAYWDRLKDRPAAIRARNLDDALMKRE